MQFSERKRPHQAQQPRPPPRPTSDLLRGRHRQPLTPSELPSTVPGGSSSSDAQQEALREKCLVAERKLHALMEGDIYLLEQALDERRRPATAPESPALPAKAAFSFLLQSARAPRHDMIIRRGHL